MKNIYKYLFYSLLSIFLIGAVFVFIHLYCMLDIEEFLNSLSIISGLIGGLAAIIASIIALISVNTWKREQRYAKFLDVLFSVKFSLREVAFLENSWYVKFSSQASKSLRDNKEIEIYDLELIENPLVSKFEAFQKSCIQLDTIEDNGWFRINQAYLLRRNWLAIRDYLLEPEHYTNGILRNEEEIIELNRSFRSSIKSIEKQLTSLEEKEIHK